MEQSKQSSYAKHYDNLVFEGGGVKGSAYAGSIAVLESLGLFAPIKQIGGTSAGAITATLLATGGGSQGLLQSVETTHFTQFIKDKGGWFGDAHRMINHYGIHTGDEFVDILQNNILDFSGNAHLTFSELDALATEQPDKFKKLTIIASNLTKQRAERFDATRYPSLPIWQAVRASISIPAIFEPVKIGDDYFVDGGLSWNYPIDLYDQYIHKTQTSPHYDQHIRNPATLGFYLEPTILEPEKVFNNHHYQIHSLKSFALGLSAFLYTTANARHLHPEDKQRTIFINDLGINATDFSLPSVKIEQLIDSGRKAAQQFFHSQTS